jgi:FixJ family two-component response regulator
MQQYVIVHIVDDDAAVRHSLEMLMKSVDLKTKSYASAQAFLDVFDATMPGCLVVDIRMPDMSGLDLLQELKQRRVEMPIIVITGHGDVPLTVRAMNEGAMTVLEKPYREQTLLDNIFKAVNSGMEAANRNLSRAVYLARIGTLSPREQEVMELLIAGKNSKEIATELNISFKTVDVHRAHIMEKMHVRSIIELVHLFLRFGPELLV